MVEPALSLAPVALPSVLPWQTLGLAVLATVAGIKQGGFKGHVFKAGLECRGVDPFMILPTEEQIMAASASAEFEDEEQGLTYVSENPHFFMRFVAQEYLQARATLALDMMPPVECAGFPEAVNATISAMTYTPEELAVYTGGCLSEILAVLKVFEPLMDEATLPDDMPEEMRTIFEPAVIYGKERVKSLLLN